MLDFLTNSLFFGVAVSLAAYEVGSLLKKKFKSPLLNPLLISIILVIAILVALDVDYQSYNISAKYLSYLLTPATVSRFRYTNRLKSLKATGRQSLLALFQVSFHVCCVSMPSP